MSAILTLLFVCHEGEDCSQFAPAPTANDRLLVAHCGEDPKLILPGEPVDAVVIHEDHLQNGCSVIAELKRVAPRTPVMLLRSLNPRKSAKPPGVVAVCRADLRDEKLVKSMWAFFRLILGKHALSSGSSAHPYAFSKRCS